MKYTPTISAFYVEKQFLMYTNIISLDTDYAF